MAVSSVPLFSPSLFSALTVVSRWNARQTPSYYQRSKLALFSCLNPDKPALSCIFLGERSRQTHQSHQMKRPCIAWPRCQIVRSVFATQTRAGASSAISHNARSRYRLRLALSHRHRTCDDKISHPLSRGMLPHTVRGDSEIPRFPMRSSAVLKSPEPFGSATPARITIGGK